MLTIQIPTTGRKCPGNSALITKFDQVLYLEHFQLHEGDSKVTHPGRRWPLQILLWHPHCGPCFTEALKVPVVNPVAVPVEGEGACFGSVDVIVEEFFRGPELCQTRS